MLGGDNVDLNKKAIKEYDVKIFRTPDGYTADIVIFTLDQKKIKEHSPAEFEIKVLLIKRAMTNAEGKTNIEAGRWAIPGGFIQETETAYEAAVRELDEETNVSEIKVKHFGVYDRPGRDPRGWIISNAHYAIVKIDALENMVAKDDAMDVRLFTMEELKDEKLAFDHEEILHDAFVELRNELLQTTIAKEFLPKEFTYSELQGILKLVTDEYHIHNSQSFARKIKKLKFIEQVEGKKTKRNSKIPAQLYRFNDEKVNPNIY